MLLKKIMCLAATVGLLWSLGSTQAQAAAAGVAWQGYAQALEMQKVSGKPVMLYFSIPYCYRCKKMEQGAYKNPGVLAAIKQEFIPVLVNLTVEADKPVGKQFGVSYTPTHLFLEPGGKQVYLLKGVAGSERFLKVLDYVSSGAYRKMDFESYEEED